MSMLKKAIDNACQRRALIEAKGRSGRGRGREFGVWQSAGPAGTVTSILERGVGGREKVRTVEKGWHPAKKQRQHTRRRSRGCVSEDPQSEGRV